MLKKSGKALQTIVGKNHVSCFVSNGLAEAGFNSKRILSALTQEEVINTVHQELSCINNLLSWFNNTPTKLLRFIPNDPNLEPP